ncbi:MAG: hypothetical protein HN956_23040, partial [Rhodospirillaceae bacterium]|nr:hypothetical protein [Rhodospirillaceae bacterium]
MKSAPQENEPDALDILARLDWARNPGFLIYDVQRLVAQVVDERMRSVGLTNAQ